MVKKKGKAPGSFATADPELDPFTPVTQGKEDQETIFALIAGPEWNNQIETTPVSWTLIINVQQACILSHTPANVFVLPNRFESEI